MEKSNSKIEKPISYKKIVFTKSYPKHHINGVTQQRYKRIKFRNKGKHFLEKLFFNKTTLNIGSLW